MWIILVLAVVFVVVIASDNAKVNARKTALQKQHDQIKNSGIHVTREYVKMYTDSTLVYRFIVDDENKNICLLTTEDGQNRSVKKIPYSDITGCQLKENIGTHKGGLGRAVAGDAIAGGAGAVVGAITTPEFVNSLRVVISLRDVAHPLYEIPLLFFPARRDSGEYAAAVDFGEKIKATVDAILAKK